MPKTLEPVIDRGLAFARCMHQHAIMRILAVVGSLGANSSNLALLKQASALSTTLVQVVLFDRLGELPFFDPDVQWDQAPTSVRAFREAIAASDALLIAAPEYGHSLPGVLKNAIDWLIGSGELEAKVVAITAAVPHPDRGRLGLAALRQTLGAVKAQIISDQAILKGQGAEAALHALLAQLVAAVEANNG